MVFLNNALRVEQPLGKIQEGFPAVGCLCYCYKVCWPESDRMCACKKGRGSGRHGVLGIFAWKKGRGSWCHGVPAILLPTFRGALGRGTCLEYLLGKRDGGVGATGCLRYCDPRFGEPREGEHAGNAFKEVTVAAHVVRAMATS